MTDDLNSVKSGAGPRREAYHHGALREGLIAAAEEVIRERGVDGFSLREAARRARVSAAAPQHHFGDARGLLTAVATLGFRGLAQALETANAGAADRRARLHAQGEAYVRFALAEPARFDVMWRKARIDPDNPDYAAAAARAFELLSAAVQDRAPCEAAPSKQADPATIAAWSLVHGFARLALDGAFGSGEGAARAATDALLPAVMARLDA